MFRGKNASLGIRLRDNLKSHVQKCWQKIGPSTVRVSLTNQCNDRSSSPAHPLQSMAAMASSNLFDDAELHLDHPGGVVGVAQIYFLR